MMTFLKRNALFIFAGALLPGIVVFAFLFYLVASFALPAHVDTTFIAPPTNSGWMIEQNGVRIWGEGAPPNPYVRHVPPPDDPAAAAARERKWVAECDPKLVRDRYGVQRYTYAAGCEFGSHP